VPDRTLGEYLEEVFRDDLEYADEVDLAAFRRRPWTERIKERAAVSISPIL
jgi:hypothetical protein